MNNQSRLWSMWFAGSLAFLMLILGSKSFAASVDTEIESLRQQWAVAKYQTPRNQQDAVFADLISRGEQLVAKNPNNAEAHLWLGTILASYTAIKGGMGALKYAKASRTQLETALKIDATVERGLGHGVLGALYARLPGWPVAFGDDKKAERHLLTAIQMDPKGIDSNYYYGDYLAEKGHKDAAREYLMRAKQAKIRKGHEVADKGRMQEIEASLKKIR